MRRIFYKWRSLHIVGLMFIEITYIYTTTTPQKNTPTSMITYQKKKTQNRQPSHKQLLWEKTRKVLEDQSIFETTEETVHRLQAQLEKDRQRWEKIKFKKNL